MEAVDPGDDLESDLAAAAERFGLDSDAILAAARAALAAADREVVLEVHTRVVA